jgi:anti-anti-sigma factor
MVVSGEWDLADEQDALRTWGAVLNSGSPGFLLDLEACTFMDSSALRMLFDINRAAEENELRWGVLGSGPAVRRLFDVTNAEEALPIVHDREAAMDLARPSRTRRCKHRGRAKRFAELPKALAEHRQPTSWWCVGKRRGDERPELGATALRDPSPSCSPHAFGERPWHGVLGLLSVRASGHAFAVLILRVACCAGCPDETEVLVETIDEVDALSCDCDYGWVVLSVSNAVPA